MAYVQTLSTVHISDSSECRILSAFGLLLKDLLEDGWVDGAIVSNETGYSPLGAEGRYLAKELGCTRGDLMHLGITAVESNSVDLVAIQNKKIYGSRALFWRLGITVQAITHL